MHDVLEAVLARRSRARRARARRRPRPRARAAARRRRPARSSRRPSRRRASAAELAHLGQRRRAPAGAGACRAAARSAPPAGRRRRRRAPRANCGARASTLPSWSISSEWPSKTSSSWPPTRLQNATAAQVVARALDEHPLALGALAGVVRRGGGVDDQRRAGQRLVGRRRARAPRCPRRSSARCARRRGRSRAPPSPAWK